MMKVFNRGAFVTLQCQRCGAIFKRYGELAAEQAFDAHKCEGMRDLYDLDFDLLRQVSYGKMTEAQAWTEHDGRRK